MQNTHSGDMPLPPPNYNTLKNDELKALLKQRNLPISGNKQELIDRLVEDDNGAGERDKWCAPEVGATYEKKPFAKEKAGPRGCPSTLSPLGAFLLFWGSMLVPLASAITELIPVMKVCIIHIV